MSTNPQLNLEEVKVRLQSYPDDKIEITNELYSFGDFLVKDATARVHEMDTKSFAIAGYAGATISVLFSTLALSKGLFDAFCGALVVAAIAVLTNVAWGAISAARPTSLHWFSDNEWIRSDCFRSADMLRRYRVQCMWGIIRGHQDAAEVKANTITNIQGRMRWAFLLVAAAFFEFLVTRSAFECLWVWVWKHVL